MTDISVATFSLTAGDNGSQVSIVFSDGSTETITDKHANFDAIVQALIGKPEGYGPVVYDLANIAKTVGRKFKNLSPRVTTDGSDLFFDGDAIDNSLAKFILKLLREDAQKSAAFFGGEAADAGDEESQTTWEALVKFLELLYANPNEKSRESLYEFISRYGLTIRKDGHFIAYKGLRDDFGSVNKGYGIVDGVEMTGALPNKPGSILRFPRKDVNSNTQVGCAQGLHAGTHAYASGWAQGKLVAVAINPTNVVSVPDDSSFQKIRVFEYEILNEVDPLDTPQATSGESSSSYWGSSQSEWRDGYTKPSYDEAIDRIAENDVVSFDYVGLDGREQKIADAEVGEIDFDQLKAFVPAKDGYRSFKFAGISNLVIEGEDAESSSKDDSADEPVSNADSGKSFFDKLAETLSSGSGVKPEELLKNFETTSEGFEKKLKDRLASIDVTQVAQADDLAEVKRILRAGSAEGIKHIEGFFGLNRPKSDSADAESNSTVEDAAESGSVISEELQREFAALKVGDIITVVLSSGERLQGASVLQNRDSMVTVRFGAGGYKVFGAEDVVELSKG